MKIQFNLLISCSVALQGPNLKIVSNHGYKLLFLIVASRQKMLPYNSNFWQAKYPFINDLKIISDHKYHKRTKKNLRSRLELPTNNYKVWEKNAKNNDIFGFPLKIRGLKVFYNQWMNQRIIGKLCHLIFQVKIRTS